MRPHRPVAAPPPVAGSQAEDAVARAVAGRVLAFRDLAPDQV